MNPKKLNDKLDALRERVIAEGCRHSGRRKEQLADLAEKLEAAKNAYVPDNNKATVLDIGDLILRAALLPSGSIFGNDPDSPLPG
jgi:hypothetical protein